MKYLDGSYGSYRHSWFSLKRKFNGLIKFSAPYGPSRHERVKRGNKWLKTQGITAMQSFLDVTLANEKDIGILACNLGENFKILMNNLSLLCNHISQSWSTLSCS